MQRLQASQRLSAQVMLGFVSELEPIPQDLRLDAQKVYSRAAGRRFALVNTFYDKFAYRQITFAVATYIAEAVICQAHPLPCSLAQAGGVAEPCCVGCHLQAT